MRTLVVLFAFSFLTLGAFARVTERFTQTYPFEANGSIHLENVNGAVEIVAWDKNEIALEAEKIASNDEDLVRVQLKIQASPTRLNIKTDYGRTWKFWRGFNAEVRYKLMVPAGVTLDKIDVVNAEVRVTGVKGAINLDTVNGGIVAKDLAGPGIFDTVNGPISVTYVTMPAKGEEISLDTVNGGCTLTLPANAAFNLDLDTVNGGTKCAFPIELAESGKHDLRGTVNGGGVTVKLDSVNGALTVRKAD